MAPVWQLSRGTARFGILQAHDVSLGLGSAVAPEVRNLMLVLTAERDRGRIG